MAQNYKETLNLPETDFPMRANSVKREPKRLAHWESIGLYDRIQQKSEKGRTFILHDGPPYANGDIHMGHALNKILKDIVLRYKSMCGFRTPYVPGWDCHGLPIEQQVLKEIGPKIHEMAPVEIRKSCHNYASKYIGIQREQFKRLGILGEWDAPYRTFDAEYEAGILRCFRDLVKRGLVRKGFKVVHWDPLFRTALAEAEIEYHPRTSDSIIVSFPLLHSEEYPSLKGLDNVSIVIWTTTPWTLPANLGISLHPTHNYVALQHDSRTSIVAEDLAEAFMDSCGIESGRIAVRFKAQELEKAQCSHPIFDDRTSLVMLGDHVTLEQGTGCVHTAPGHGCEDFDIGRRYGLPVVVPVDEKGCFTREFPAMEGVFVFDANPTIVDLLRNKGLLLASGKVIHDYPFSWRSKEPVIFRATEQWFMELGEGDIREKALDAIDNAVQWIPRWGYERIRNMVENRPDWCLSRQRSWGVPIPSIRSNKTGESILDVGIIDAFIESVSKEGTDCWFRDPVEKFLPDDFVYESTGECNGEDFSKENDILDVWFDSGASHVASLEQDSRLSSPADLYLEGSDQHRGWFQSALLTSIGTRHRAPFKAVLTHGFLLDGQGKAMSKSSGNSVSPLELIEKMGSDILRLWVASVDYRNDVRVSEEIISHVVETYRTIRNTLRFQLGNLSGFDAKKDSVSLSELFPIDTWALHKTAEVVVETRMAYESYEFQRVYQIVNRYCTVTLSAIYHDILKDRLYTFQEDSMERRSAQTVISHCFETLVGLLAPVIVFTTDEAYSYARSNRACGDGSIHLQPFPEAREEWFDSGTCSQIDRLLKVRGRVNDELERLRQEKTIGQSLEAAVNLVGNDTDELFQLLVKHAAILPELFIVSQVSLNTDNSANHGIEVSAQKCEGLRCPRCWRWVPEETSDGRADGFCPRIPCPLLNH